MFTQEGKEEIRTSDLCFMRHGFQAIKLPLFILRKELFHKISIFIFVNHAIVVFHNILTRFGFVGELISLEALYKSFEADFCELC
jgi:hypothetical protein